MADVAVVGGGPAGLMAAETLVGLGHAVTVYEKMPSLGRRLLMAGRGGLNLTHSEPLPAFLSRYGDDNRRLAEAIPGFPPEALRAWAEGLGQQTFVGTSGRVFPQAMKASPLLRAWIARLEDAGVGWRLRHSWAGWAADGGLVFETPQGAATARPDATVLALGGASWPRLGADGAWAPLLVEAGAAVSRFAPANMGFAVAWSPGFAARHAGQPLKAVALTFQGRTVRGEALVAAYGLEGGALYALSRPLREAMTGGHDVTIALDLRPDQTAGALAQRLDRARPGDSLSNRLRKALRLSPLEIGLLREAFGADLPRESFALASAIKTLPLTLIGHGGLERAISSAGGLTFDSLDERWMLRSQPGVFAAGEMLDWEAPTGGYLLQASFATGRAAALGLNAWLAGAT
ncbi:MAG: TIGR03862 family flavoprotein [Caulobacteraceae bacterium]|nr:TIGR03862 family flavoprotein [Caulobacteraceae bacterium]